jgi:large subunit ribosomal protein L18
MGLSRREKRVVRQVRVRDKVRGTKERPRLCVYRSLKHISVQVIDDIQAHTLIAVSTLSPELKGKLKKTADKAAAKEVGKLAGEKCKDKNIKKVVFDRNGFLFHGRIKAVADGAREAGLEF